MDFAETLLDWYRKNKRNLPWRTTSDAYSIWLSEIILQQTRVAQGRSYYDAFLVNFPTVADLAAASEDRVLKLWQGLGYYSRARNLHFTAKEIVAKHKGKFPKNYQEILALKGIGEYTAAAIASFAYQKPHAVVDGNVYRVLSRIFGIETAIDSPLGKKEFAALADELLLRKNPGEYNQAIMEFGALYCLPKKPDCLACCMRSICEAKRKNKVDVLPFKQNKTKQRTRYFNYLMLESGPYTFIQQRGAGDIWQGLYEFPLIETLADISEKKLMQTAEWKKIFGKENLHVLHISGYYKHVLSHQILQARFWKIELTKSTFKKFEKSYLKIKREELNNYALPRLIDKVLNKKS